MNYIVACILLILTLTMSVVGLFMFVTDGYTPMLERLCIATAITTAATFAFGMGCDL